MPTTAGGATTAVAATAEANGAFGHLLLKAV
jgi:hypothetical protein